MNVQPFSSGSNQAITQLNNHPISQPDFSELPEEILVQIFQEYTKFEDSNRSVLEVCKHFYRIGFEHFGSTVTTQLFLEKMQKNSEELISTFKLDQKPIQEQLPKVNLSAAIGLASEKGYVESVKELLKDPSIDPSLNKNYAIWIASNKGHVEVIKELLKDRRVDPSAENNEALRGALVNGHEEVVKEFLQSGRVRMLNANDNYIIRMASRRGYAEVVKLLLQDPRVDPSANKNEALYDAIACGHVEVIKLLLKNPRINPSADKNEALRKAIVYGYIEVVKLFLKDPRIDPSFDNNYPICYASEKGDIELVKLLLKDPRVDPSADNDYAINKARERGHVEVVKTLSQNRLFSQIISPVSYEIFQTNIFTSKEQTFSKMNQRVVQEKFDRYLKVYLSKHPEMNQQKMLPSLKFTALCVAVKDHYRENKQELTNDIFYPFLPAQALKQLHFKSKENFLNRLSILEEEFIKNL